LLPLFNIAELSQTKKDLVGAHIPY